MSGKPDPKPKRVRGKLRSVKQLGGRCQVCGDTSHVERMHLLRGSRKEDVEQLVMLGCGDFGKCRIHPRFDQGRGGDRIMAAAEIRAVMYDAQELALRQRLGDDGFEQTFPIGGFVGGEFTILVHCLCPEPGIVAHKDCPRHRIVTT